MVQGESIGPLAGLYAMSVLDDLGAPYLTPRTRNASDYPTSQDLDAPGWRDKNWDFSEWFSTSGIECWAP